jgi:hypothetical protein
MIDAAGCDRFIDDAIEAHLRSWGRTDQGTLQNVVWKAATSLGLRVVKMGVVSTRRPFLPPPGWTFAASKERA